MERIDADRPGKFKAKVLNTGIMQSKKSQACAVSFRFLLTDYLDPESKSWVPCAEYGQTIFGKIWVALKDGSANEDGAKNLSSVFGWSGKLSDFNQADGKWPPCQVVLEEEEYEGVTRIVVKWINSYDGQGGGKSFSNVDETLINDLDARLGAQFRAIAGNVARSRTANEPATPAGEPADGETDDDQPF